MAVAVVPIMGLIVILVLLGQAIFPDEDVKPIKKEKQKIEYQIQKDVNHEDTKGF